MEFQDFVELDMRGVLESLGGVPVIAMSIHVQRGPVTHGGRLGQDELLDL